MAWNVFKFCTPLRALGSVMIVLVLGIVGLSYYALVVVNYGPAILRGGLESVMALTVLLLFHALLVMLLWSYFSVVMTDPGGVPLNWRPMLDEEKGDMDPLVGLEHNGLEPQQSTMSHDPSDQRLRFCRKCNHFKPPRCHHCSVCGRCVLKMDHHCVWVVNCVGALNYKSFLLFLFYTFLETTLVTLSLLPYFVPFFTDSEVTGAPGTLAAVFIAFILNLTFALSVLGFLIMHVSLVAANTTTIEAYEKKASSKWIFDLGRKRNFEQVDGRWVRDFLPLRPATEGEKHYSTWNNQSAGSPPSNTGSSSRRGIWDGEEILVHPRIGLKYLGWRRNIGSSPHRIEVFGMEKKYWFIPAYSEEDLRRMPALQGLEYPTKLDLTLRQQL